MRRIICLSLAAITLTACSSETTSPGSDLLAEAGEFGGALTVAGGYDAALYHERLINALPDELKLSTGQQQKIRALVEAFVSATRADRDALHAILREARQAAESGKSREEIRTILARAAPIRVRLAAAEARLKSDIDAVLTAEQRAWIAAHTPRECRPDRFPALTDAQKAQIRALETAFRANNAADLATVRSVLEEAAAAFRSGRSRDEILAILQRAAPAVLRLAAARRDLVEQIVAVLTPEQRASGCLPLG